MTSTNRAAGVIHRISHELTTISYDEHCRQLVLHVESECLQSTSPKWLMLLTDAQAYEWLCNMGELNHKYGSRTECTWCVR
jgi:hypothetical protein